MNREIRRKAKVLFFENAARFIASSAILSVPAVVVSLFPVFPGLWNSVLSLAIRVLTFPLQMGGILLYYNSYLSHTFSFGDIFYYYSNKEQLHRALVVGACVQFTISFFSIGSQLMHILYYANHPIMVLVLRMIIAVILTIFTFRLYLVPYIFVKQAELQPLKIIQHSFRATKGYFFDLLGFQISIVWQPFLFLLGYSMVIVIFGLRVDSPGISIPLLLCSILYAPYWTLCDVGFASNWLLPRKRLKINREFSRNGTIFRYKVDWPEC